MTKGNGARSREKDQTALRTLLRRLHSTRAQAMVEFALILPAFVFLLISMLQFGVLINAQLVVADAARQGARVMALVQPTDPNWQSTVATDVQNDLSGGGLSLAPSNYSPTWPYVAPDLVESITGSGSSASASVSVTYRVPNFAPGLPVFFGQPALAPYITLTSTATFMIEP